MNNQNNMDNIKNSLQKWDGEGSEMDERIKMTKQNAALGLIKRFVDEKHLSSSHMAPMDIIRNIRKVLEWYEDDDD